VAQGKRYYLKSCVHCHGADARGDDGPDLHDLRKADAALARVIRHGLKKEMPGFGNKYGDADIRALLAYLRSLDG
jgi:mono/diheme cytochrome c family protein